MTPWQTAHHMIRARRPDGTPIDAGLIVAYLEHEAMLADLPARFLAPPKTVADYEALHRYTLVKGMRSVVPALERLVLAFRAAQRTSQSDIELTA